MLIEELNFTIPKTTDRVWFGTNLNGSWIKKTYNEDNKHLSYECSNGFWRNNTYDKDGNLLRYERGYKLKNDI